MALVRMEQGTEKPELTGVRDSADVTVSHMGAWNLHFATVVRPLTGNYWSAATGGPLSSSPQAAVSMRDAVGLRPSQCNRCRRRNHG